VASIACLFGLCVASRWFGCQQWGRIKERKAICRGTDEKSDLDFFCFQANFVNSLQGLIFLVISARKLALDNQSRFRLEWSNPSEGLNIQRLFLWGGDSYFFPLFLGLSSFFWMAMCSSSAIVAEGANLACLNSVSTKQLFVLCNTLANCLLSITLVLIVYWV
jgi:hypothetical protein